MKRIPDHIVNDITSRTDIIKVVSEYVRLEKRGSRWVGLCPFHNEKTPSFGVNAERGFFYCFGCKKGGDAITFIKEIEKCSYVEALERLAEKAGIVISYEGEEDPAEALAARERDSLYELYERLAGTFNHLLVSDSRGENALKYVRSRALPDDIVKSFRLGYAPADRGWLFRFLRNKSYSADFLSRSGLFSSKHQGMALFSDRLMFPISDHRGRVIAFGGRLLSGDGPKYLNSPETPIFHKHETLFALHAATSTMRLTSEAILCEGYMDALAFHTSGVSNAVAPLGTSFTEAQASLLKRYVGTIIIGFDSDVAGRNASERAIHLVEGAGLAARVLRFDGFKDAAEILEKKGPERLKKNIVSTITADDFIIGNAVSILGGGGSQSQTAAFDYVFAYIAGLGSDIRRDSLIEVAAARLGADPISVRNDFARFQRKGTNRIVDSEKPAQALAFVPSMDAELLAAIVANASFFKDVRAEISSSDFDEEALRDAFITLEECFRDGSMNVATITARFANEGLRAFVLQRISEGAYAINPERFIMDGVRMVKERALERKKQRIVTRIREYDESRDGDEISMNDLLYEKMFLDSELTRIKDERHERS